MCIGLKIDALMKFVTVWFCGTLGLCGFAELLPWLMRLYVEDEVKQNHSCESPGIDSYV